MAIPTIVTLTENEWVIVATGVTTGVIDRKATGIKYYQTYRNTGDTAPTNPTTNQIPDEAIQLFKNGEQAIISSRTPIDVYILSKREDKEITTQGKVRVNV